MDVTQYQDASSGLVAAGATTVTVRLRQMEHNERTYVNRLLLRNRDTAASVAIVYVERGGNLRPVLQKTITTDNVWYDDQLECWLYPGDRIRVDFSTCTAADNVDVSVIGITRYDVR